MDDGEGAEEEREEEKSRNRLCVHFFCLPHHTVAFHDLTAHSLRRNLFTSSPIFDISLDDTALESDVPKALEVSPTLSHQLTFY
jgi:hypothetical protein